MDCIEPYVIQPNASLRDAMSLIDKNSKGIVFVVGPKNYLLGSISDGDIRRAILEGITLETPVQSLIDKRKQAGGSRPVTASVDATDADLLKLMNESEIRQIPVTDSEGRILRITFLPDLVRDYEAPMTAVIMAGGFGTRLRPLTENTPKPMLPVGNKPILEWTIEQLKKTGINQISLTTHYHPEAISKHFGNGDNFGVEINYVHEEKPLGTAGALGLLGRVKGPLLVMNGDILTRVDFRSMLEFHRKKKSCLTVGVRQYAMKVPYGVIECKEERVCSVSEKPELRFLVNAGIYLLEGKALEYIPHDHNFDMPDLIQSLINDNQVVVSFPIVEYWLDVGRPADYEQAQVDFGGGRLQ